MKKNLFFLISLLFLINCDLFQMRESEEPSGSSDFQAQLPVTVDNVIYNFTNSFSYMKLQHYEACFSSDEFNFYLTPDDAYEFPQLSNPIDWDDEKLAITSIFSYNQDYSQIEMTLSKSIDDDDEITNSKVTYYRVYAVELENNIDNEKVFSGKMKIILKKKEDNLWYITSINDYIYESGNTWGYLKAKHLTR